MSFVSGRSGPCEWALIQGDLDDTSTDQFVTHLRDVATRIQPGQVVLDITRNVSMPSPVQRKRIVDVLQSSSKLDVVAGHALVISSTLGRGLMTAINWVVRPPFEERICANPVEALEWLKSLNPALEPANVLASIERASPGFARLTW